MSKNISQILPKGDKLIIKDALIQYERTLSCLIDKFEREGNESMVDQLHYTRHDLYSLIAYTEYDMVVNLPQEVKDNFVHKHGVDFPLYIYEVLKYPVEQESKWVTLITGDFSFIDDGVHGRECHVNQLTTIEKHLREDVGEVIDCVENDGGGWIIAEDYDGHIQMNFDKPKKDEREFQVVWLASHYDASTTHGVRINEFDEDSGYDFEDRENIDKLEVGGNYETQLGGVLVIRIK